MPKLPDIISTAVEQRRDLRFWHNAARLTISPYIYGLTDDGDAIVTGVTSAGDCVSLRCSELVGVEIVPRRRHPLCSWDSGEIATTLVAAPRAS